MEDCLLLLNETTARGPTRTVGRVASVASTAGVATVAAVESWGRPKKLYRPRVR